jgi:hypothetical protein
LLKKIPEPQEEKYVLAERFVYTQSESAGPQTHIATELEERFVRRRGKQSQSDVWCEKVGSKKCLSCNACMGSQDKNFEHNLENMYQKDNVQCY